MYLWKYELGLFINPGKFVIFEKKIKNSKSFMQNIRYLHLWNKYVDQSLSPLKEGKQHIL